MMLLRARVGVVHGGGELGGRKSATYVWGAFFVSLWLIYIVLSIMITKGHITSPSWL